MDSAVAAQPTVAPSPDSVPLRLTAAAVTQVKEVIKAQGFEGFYLTIRVAPSGCSGLGYDLNLMKDTKDGDFVWEQDGIQLATDAMSRSYLEGTEVDFQSSSTQAGFKFNNPNARSSCGCGSSFSA